MRTRKFIYNSITSASLQIVTMLVGFIVPRIMLQYYGSEINGLVSSINQFIAYFNLVEAGLASAAIYALYKPLADNDHKAINMILSATKRFYTKSGYIFVSLTLGLSIIYPIFVTSNELSPLFIILLVFCLGFKGALEFFTLAKYRVLLTAHQKTYIISIASIIQIIIYTLVIIVLSIYNVHIVILKAISLLSVFIRSLILMAYVKKNYKFLDYKEIPNYAALNKRWDALYLQILGSTQRGAPIVLATLFTTLQTVSIYSIYNMIMGGINGVLSIFTSGLSASFGEVIARNENKILQKAYKEFEFSYYSIITVIYSITMITLMPFIRIYTNGITDTNYDIPILGLLIVLNGLLYNIKTPQGMLIISSGLFKETRTQTTIQVLIIIILGVILAPAYGLVGILIASCLSNLYRDIELLFYVPKYVTKIPVNESAMRIFCIIIEVLLINVPFIFIKIKIVNYFQWFIFASIVGVYSIIVVGLFGIIFFRTQFINVLIRIKSIFRKKI